MPFRPEQHFRRRRNVIYALTEAIRRIYGARSQDGAYPLGAFYTENINRTLWEHVGGICYRPTHELDLDGRSVDENTVIAFMSSIESGETIHIQEGEVVSWEPIPDPEASELQSWRSGSM